MKCYLIQAGMAIGILAAVIVGLGILFLLMVMFGALGEKVERAIPEKIGDRIFLFCFTPLLAFGVGLSLWIGAGNLMAKFFHWCVG